MALTQTRTWTARACAENPWFWPLRALNLDFPEHATFPSPEELTAVFRERIARLGLWGAPYANLSFQPAEKKTKRRRPKTAISMAQLYEGRVVEARSVPTRLHDWHDHFNALAFASFPRAKWALHRRQHAILRSRIEPGATRLPSRRTREQDALALFDEGGVAVALDREGFRELVESEPDDLTAPVASLKEQGRAVVVPFGHALFEHLVLKQPCPLSAHHLLPILPLPDSPRPPPQVLLDAVDQVLARDLADPRCFGAPHPSRALSLDGLALTEADVECILKAPCSPP